MGVEENHALAVQWLRKAAEQGDARAQYFLGRMYDDGRGVSQDNAEAAKWYRKAVDQGDVDAQVYLGELPSILTRLSV